MRRRGNAERLRGSSVHAEGCVRSRWEKEGVARREQRPPRRYYELTSGGKTIALDARTRTQAMAEAGRRLLEPVESEG